MIVLLAKWNRANFEQRNKILVHVFAGFFSGVTSKTLHWPIKIWLLAVEQKTIVAILMIMLMVMFLLWSKRHICLSIYQSNGSNFSLVKHFITYPFSLVLHQYVPWNGIPFDLSWYLLCLKRENWWFWNRLDVYSEGGNKPFCKKCVRDRLHIFSNQLLSNRYCYYIIYNLLTYL